MASKKIGLTSDEAAIILGYYSAIIKESGYIITSLGKSLESLESKNNELADLYGENINQYVKISSLGSFGEILKSLIEIDDEKKKRIPKDELLMTKGLFENYLKVFESNAITYFNTVKALKKDAPEVVKAEIEVLDSIENLRFLANRVIKLIDSKI